MLHNLTKPSQRPRQPQQVAAPLVWMALAGIVWVPSGFCAGFTLATWLASVRW